MSDGKRDSLSGDKGDALPPALYGRPACVRHPELLCRQECEYGLAGPCVRDAMAASDIPKSPRQTKPAGVV